MDPLDGHSHCHAQCPPRSHESQASIKSLHTHTHTFHTYQRNAPFTRYTLQLLPELPGRRSRLANTFPGTNIMTSFNSHNIFPRTRATHTFILIHFLQLYFILILLLFFIIFNFSFLFYFLSQKLYNFFSTSFHPFTNTTFHHHIYSLTRLLTYTNYRHTTK